MVLGTELSVAEVEGVFETFRDLLSRDPLDFASSGALLKKVVPRKKAVAVIVVGTATGTPATPTPGSAKPKRAPKRSAKKKPRDSDDDDDDDDEAYED